MEKTVRLTTAQALVRFLDNQYVSFDGKETKFVEGIFTIFGHGIAVGLGEALYEDPGKLKVFQGRNEQGMCHTACAFARQNNRRKIIACTSSVGPGAANMVTACADATVNHIPLLVFPADTFASRQPDPVLQQLENEGSLTVTTNDAFKPVCKYFDRINRPEQIMTAMINAMRVLTDPANTGAVCISLPQDIEGEAADFPEYFFKKRIHRIVRQPAAMEEIEDVVARIKKSKKPLVIVGGGVRYSEAGTTVERFCSSFGIPFGETQSGKSACKSSHAMCLGGIGVTGTLSANTIAKKADLIIALGSRLSDFTTGSKRQFKENVDVVSININRFDAYKMDAVKAVGDLRATLELVIKGLKKAGYKSSYSDEIAAAKRKWDKEMERLSGICYTGSKFRPNIEQRDPRTLPEFHELTGSVLTQTAAIATVRACIGKDANIVTAGGSLPSDLQRMWTTDETGAYHAEYGYSCMGYEVSGALGVKLAQPKKEVYAFLGDGSFLMMHSEIATAIQEKTKINLLVFDNCGFGCINNLEMTHGIGSLATEFRYRDDDGRLSGNLIPIDYAMIGKGYGLKTYTVKNCEELKEALLDAAKQKNSTLIDLKVMPKTMTDGYESWWDVGLAAVSESEDVRNCRKEVEEGRKEARKY